jgi:hypothetical protein
MNKAVVIVFLLTVFFALTVTIAPAQAQVYEYTTESSAFMDCYAEKGGDTWLETWNATAADDIEQSGNTFTIGTYGNVNWNWVDGWTYDYYGIGRGFTVFDLTYLPSDANITEAIFSLYVNYDGQENINVTIQGGDFEYPIALGDFYQGNISGAGGTRNCSSMVAGQYWNISLTEAGIAFLSLSEYSTLCVRSHIDVDGVDPVTVFGEEGDYYSQLVRFGTVEANYPAKLYLTYDSEEPEPTPTPPPQGGGGGGGSSGWLFTASPYASSEGVQVDAPKWAVWGIVAALLVVFFTAVLSGNSKKKTRSKNRK